jgi:hypothetical protein
MTYPIEYKVEKLSKTKATLHVIKKFKDWEKDQSYDVTKIKRHGFGKAIEIEFADSSAPTFSLKNLMELGEFFGTVEIDFNNSINREGCPTCGEGAEFGYNVEIYRIKKNYPFDNVRE